MAICTCDLLSVGTVERLPELFCRVAGIEFDLGHNRVVIGLGFKTHQRPIVSIQPFPHLSEFVSKIGASNTRKDNPHNCCGGEGANRAKVDNRRSCGKRRNVRI